jgi:hypothetical protein
MLRCKSVSSAAGAKAISILLALTQPYRAAPSRSYERQIDGPQLTLRAWK